MDMNGMSMGAWTWGGMKMNLTITGMNDMAEWRCETQLALDHRSHDMENGIGRYEDAQGRRLMLTRGQHERNMDMGGKKMQEIHGRHETTMNGNEFLCAGQGLTPHAGERRQVLS